MQSAQNKKNKNTPKVSISEDAEERQGVAVHSVVGIRGIQTFQQVSDVAHVDASFTHCIGLWRAKDTKSGLKPTASR